MIDYKSSNKDKIINTPGGNLCQVYGNIENRKCSIALVEMDINSKGVQHFHDNITEIYLFSDSNGSIIINGEEIQVKKGECYIIYPNTLHYIKSYNKMKFCCICNPPWTQEHEFIQKTLVSNSKFAKIKKSDEILKLSGEVGNSVYIYNVKGEFNPDANQLKYTRVYYFLSGKGYLIINNEQIDIKSGECYEVLNNEKERIVSEKNLKFALICEG